MNDSQGTLDPAGVLVAMLGRMLRPLVRLLVGQQVHYPLISRMLKALYIEVASEDFALTGKRLTVSRLSLLTGIHRREVKRIQEETAPGEQTPPSAITLGAQIVARWTGEAPWVDAEGRPIPLVRQSEDRDVPSFYTLVNSISVDIHPRSVLDEWVRIGVAKLMPEGEVVLSSDAFIRSCGFEEKAHFIGRNVRDHLAAAEANLDAETSPFIERSVFYESLPAEDVAALQTFARQVGQEALERVNDRAQLLKTEAEMRKNDDPVENRRITFGVYQFDAPTETEAETDGEGSSEFI